MLFALVCYGFTNKSFADMEPAERVDRLCYLHIWLVVCAMRLLCSAIDFHLQTMPYEYSRKLTKWLFANVALHVLLLAFSILFIWYCWPLGSMPFWQYFWAVVVVLNAVTSVSYSLLRVCSALAVYCSRLPFNAMEFVVLSIKMLWMLVLTVFSLWLLALASTKEWNALTLVMLIGYVICQGSPHGRLLMACGRRVEWPHAAPGILSLRICISCSSMSSRVGPARLCPLRMQLKVG